MADQIYIEALKAEDESGVVDLIRRNLAGFNERETVLVATFRRLEKLMTSYTAQGCRFYVAKDSMKNNIPIACVGLGPLHGLPSSEGVGEIRDLVVEEEYRGRGLGGKLLHLCIGDAKNFGYNRLYLETSKHMKVAQRLFLRVGFRAVREKTDRPADEAGQDLPSYFLMENL